MLRCLAQATMVGEWEVSPRFGLGVPVFLSWDAALALAESGSLRRKGHIGDGSIFLATSQDLLVSHEINFEGHN